MNYKSRMKDKETKERKGYYVSSAYVSTSRKIFMF